MSTHTLHPADYLNRLRRAGRGLPRSRLKELAAETEEHLSEAIPPKASDAEALTVLDRLGEPEEIIDAEEPRPDALQDTPGPASGPRSSCSCAGGVIFGIGWPRHPRHRRPCHLRAGADRHHCLLARRAR
ncbi:MAG: hypothetical protein M3071_06310 [Actinomycetota bacterium]|nr:hypothetical protein [Actinomycetota bacterium]